MVELGAFVGARRKDKHVNTCELPIHPLRFAWFLLTQNSDIASDALLLLAPQPNCACGFIDLITVDGLGDGYLWSIAS